MKLPIAEPADGWQKIERIFLREIILSTYRAIKDPKDQFIIMAINEAGYTQDEVAIIMGISQVAVHKRLRNTLLELRQLKKEEKL